MKTIAFSGNRNIGRALFVLAALGGLYYFRRSGKSVSDLLASGTDGLKQARTFINRVAPSVVNQGVNQGLNQAARGQSIAANAQL